MEALKAVENERLDEHEAYTLLDDGDRELEIDPTDAGYSRAIRDAENAIKSLITSEDRMESRPEPKFKVGQVVVMASVKKELPFRILFVEWGDCGWFYGWNSKNAVSESSIRKLTPEEVGLGSQCI